MATVTLRPNSDVSVACRWYPTSTHFWNVDEATPNDADYNYEIGVWTSQDTLGLPNPSLSGLITNVSLRTRLEVESGGESGLERIRPKLVVSGSPYYGTTRGPGTARAEYADNWANNPATSNPWTWAEINALNIGYEIRGDEFTGEKEPEEFGGFVFQQYIIVTYTPPPAPPTNVQATDGAHSDKVVVTWTKSAGATQYQVYRDGAPLGWLGDVATFDDTGAGAPSITPGSASASDGTSYDHVALSLSGMGTNNGATHTYKVRAKNAGGESGDSATDTGYRAPGALTYQWQRSSGDADSGYGNIIGAITASYNDTGAPSDGSGRYYRCVENAPGAAEQNSSSDRGYRIGQTTYNTKVGSPTSWGWEKCDYSSAEKCPVGSETSWTWQAPTAGGPDKTPQGGPTSFGWGSE